MRGSRSVLLGCVGAAALALSATPARAGHTTVAYVLPDTVSGSDATYVWAGETCGLAAARLPGGPPNTFTGVLTAGPWAVLDRNQLVVTYNPPGVDAGASTITITCTILGSGPLTFTFPRPGPAVAPIVQPVTFVLQPQDVLQLCTTVSWTPTSTNSPYVHGCVDATTIESVV